MFAGSFVPDTLFFQFFYTGKVSVWSGRFEVFTYKSWADVLLSHYASFYDNLEKLDFYVGSQLCFPVFTSSGWMFKFFSRREYSRPVSDFSIHLLADGTTKAAFNLKHSQPGQVVKNFSIDWFSVYFGYLFHLDLSLPDALFRSFDGNFYRVFCEGDFFDGRLDWSVLRYGIDAVDYRALLLNDEKGDFVNVC